MKKIGSYLAIFLAEVCLNTVILLKVCEKGMCRQKDRTDRVKENFNVCYKWLRAYQNKGIIEDVFHDEKISEIAIYGMGKLGIILLEELKKTDISVKYIIDRNEALWKKNYLCLLPSDKLPDVQAIIITPIWEYDKIVSELKEKIDTRVISLEKIIDKL